MASLESSGFVPPVVASLGPSMPASSPTWDPVSSNVAGSWGESSVGQAGDSGNQPVANTEVIAVPPQSAG